MRPCASPRRRSPSGNGSRKASSSSASSISTARTSAFCPPAGLIWIPNDANRLELIFPRPRFLHRFRQTAIFEDWWSIGAEFGGGEWAIQRAGGADDVVDITDYRITAGFERKSIDYLVGIRFEVGYVFGREIEYTSGAPGFEPTDTVLIRAGFFY